MPEVWTHPTAIDTLTTWTSAQCVSRKRLDPDDPSSPLVPHITIDAGLRVLAEYILSLDAIDRLTAYSVYDLSGVRVTSCKHIAFANRDANPNNYDIEQELRAFVDGIAARLPDRGSAGEFHGHLWPLFEDPRGTVGAIVPEMQRTRSGRYSQEPAIRRGSLLNQARAVQHARSVAIDAGLAATAAASWTAARAAALAQAQSAYPLRNYT